MADLHVKQVKTKKKKYLIIKLKMLLTAVAIIRGSGVHCRHHLGAQHFRHHRHLQSLCQHAHQRNACGEIPVDRRAEKRLEMARNRYTQQLCFYISNQRF